MKEAYTKSDVNFAKGLTSFHINCIGLLYQHWPFDLAPLVITSAYDGKHMTGSYHYKGKALDIRIVHIPEKFWAEIVKDLKRLMGEEYDVILEKDHIHIEPSPSSSWADVRGK